MIEIPDKLKREEINFVLLEPKGKKPFEKNWQKKQIKFNSPELDAHLSVGGNYGVMGGGDLKLLVVDFDDEKVQEEVIKKLPPTFTVKTGGGLLHKYFFSSRSDSFKIFSKDMDTLSDIQGEGKQVVGPGSIHPNGNNYEVIDDVDIAFIEYSELKAIMMKYDKKPGKKEKVLKEISKPYQDDSFIQEIQSTISIEDVLKDIGIDTSNNPGPCPFHESKGGKCLGWTDKVAHCFHCDGSWNIFTLIQDHKKIGFKEALEYLVDKAGLQKQYEENKKRWKENNKVKNAIRNFLDKTDLAEKIWKAQPFFYDRSHMWWLWDRDNCYWEIVDDKDILIMVSDNSSANTVESKEKNEILEAMEQFGRRKIPQPIKETWIQFKDTIVDVNTGEEFKATPEYFVTNPIPWALHKERFVETPVIDRIFKEWVGEDYVKTLYEIISYCILPSMPIHRIFCLIGAGMNGKSCFLNLLRKFIGTKNCCSTELDTLLASRFEVTRLHKKLVCQMGETNFNEMSKTSLLKKLSGGDLIGFEYKNKNPFEENNYAKIIIATNNLPTTTDKTIGFYRRWMIIDFPNQFSEKKDILKDIPEEEYEILAVKCLGIIKDLLDKREFHKEGSIEERKEKYEAKSNFLETFLEQFTEKNELGHITSADFFKKFSSWCKENRHREMSETSVGRDMKKLGVESDRKYFKWLFNGKGGQLRCWVGIKWKGE